MLLLLSQFTVVDVDDSFLVVTVADKAGVVVATPSFVPEMQDDDGGGGISPPPPPRPPRRPLSSDASWPWWRGLRRERTFFIIFIFFVICVSILILISYYSMPPPCSCAWNIWIDCLVVLPARGIEGARGTPRHGLDVQTKTLKHL